MVLRKSQESWSKYWTVLSNKKNSQSSKAKPEERSNGNSSKKSIEFPSAKRENTQESYIRQSGYEKGSPGLFTEKERVRSELLDTRLSLSSQEISSGSERTADNLFRLELFKTSENLALYFPIKKEVATQPIFERAKKLGKEVYFPKVVGSLLRFLRVDDLAELVPGKFGIPEPLHPTHQIPLNELDLIVVPGVGFDLSGERMGYGGGYYDRTLNGVHKGKLVGLAFDFQIVNWIPRDVTDKSVGVVVGESNIIFCNGRGIDSKEKERRKL